MIEHLNISEIEVTPISLSVYTIVTEINKTRFIMHYTVNLIKCAIFMTAF